MRQNTPQRRGRGRPSGRRGFSNSPNRSYDSSGPEVKVRGTASAVYDKYQALGRDAILSGDRVAAENFFQHGEHYYRLMQAAKQQAGESEQRDIRRQEQQNRDEFGDEPAEAGSHARSTSVSEEAVIEEAVSEEAVVEVVGNSLKYGEDYVAAADLATANAGDAYVEAASDETMDEFGGKPMNPAELAAMSESGRKSRPANSGNGRGRQKHDSGDQGDAGAETAGTASRRQPRRRRRPAADAAVGESGGEPAL